MSDSDETVCDDGEDLILSSRSQISPSIIAPLLREGSLEPKASGESKITLERDDSPEFLPTSAKVQKLTKEKTELAEEVAAKRGVDQELQSTHLETTSNAVKPASERLKSIREKEEKIEELLMQLESNIKRGVSLRESPIFARVKLLMTQVKSQLAEFTHYQQQQRQWIAMADHESQDTQDGSETRWTAETKQKILELATQQKELLKLFHCHKKLLEKIQALKQRAKSGTKHILPAVEVHHRSQNRITNMQQEGTDKSTKQVSSTTLTASNVNQPRFTTRTASRPTGVSEKVHEHSVNRLNPISSSLKHVSNSTTHLLNHQTSSAISSTSSQVIPSVGKTLPHSGSSSHASTLTMHSISNVAQTQTSGTLSTIAQPRVQNVVLTAGQLYQVGDKQIYVLPQGLITNAPSSLAATQVTQRDTPAMIPQYTTATVATKVPMSQPSTCTLMPISTMAKPTQSCALNTLSNQCITGSYSQDQTVQSFSQLSTYSTQAPNTGVTLPVSRTILPTNSLTSTLATSADGLLTTSSTLSTSPHFKSQGNKQIAHAVIPLATSENRSAPLLQRSAREQSQYTKPSQSTALLSSFQAARTTTYFTSKAPTLQSRCSTQSLQRRNSYGSELLDMKSLLSRNVIEPGSNVLSMQFEGRNFEASLRSSGLIESAGGETFRTPMAWMRAVTGSWNTVKQSQAYKMVHYKGKPLALFTIPTADEKESCEDRGIQNDARTASIAAQDGQDKTNKESKLITSWDDVAQLLTNCQVIPIGRDEFVPTASFLPANFWESASEVNIPSSVLEELEF